MKKEKKFTGIYAWSDAHDFVEYEIYGDISEVSIVYEDPVKK